MPIQKLLLFMQTSTKNYKLVVGGVFVASLEGFTTVNKSFINISRKVDFNRCI